MSAGRGLLEAQAVQERSETQRNFVIDRTSTTTVRPPQRSCVSCWSPGREGILRYAWCSQGMFGMIRQSYIAAHNCGQV